jgi:hypothetical protein
MFLAAFAVPAAVAQTVDLPALDGKNVPPQMLESIRRAYCQDEAEANAFIDELAKLSRSNGARLRQGSSAEYETVVVRRDTAGKELERTANVERWEVASVVGKEATVRISGGDGSYSVQKVETDKLIFGAKLTPDKPMSCYLWHFFAASYGRGTATVAGQKLETLSRQQAEMGNALPSFTYGKGVPFDVVRSSELSRYDGSEVERIKTLKSYKF